ncbi:MAG: HAD family hydrolase [Acidimicrobiales bacterium]|nr:HAD family hydrolase [Acidimicrobiales bacterium]
MSAVREPSMGGRRVSLRAVTFDFWNTLIAADGEPALEVRAAAWSEELATLGTPRSVAEILAAFDAGWRRYDERWAANEQTDVVRFTREALEDLRVQPTGPLVAALAECYIAAAVALEHPLLPGVAAALGALTDAGIAVGIVCDVGMTPSQYLRGYLDRANVLDAFDHWSFSDEVGVYKPHRDIFAHALTGLGVQDPTQAVHVGDLRRTDIAGARAFGMTAIRYAGAFDDPPGEPVVEGHAVIAHHDELVDALYQGRTS